MNRQKPSQQPSRKKSNTLPSTGSHRRLHKAFLRYHDPNNWPLLRDALKAMGRADLIGNGKQHLIPTFQPLVDGSYQSARKKNSTSSKPHVGGLGYAVNKDGKAVAVAPRRPQAQQEPKGDVRFRSEPPKAGQILTQHTGMPPRAGVTGKGRPAKPGASGPRKAR